ncbi:hypothetical protein AB0K02_23250 [Streptomyces sp. NPDC049597]
MTVLGAVADGSMRRPREPWNPGARPTRQLGRWTSKAPAAPDAEEPVVN